ncbi:hypothetical protein GWK47_012988 [Chionoecetes opilio]|uniref:Uncharacterized protein n=1 Tax=Chionoecetes opilio TaxID=41210 RepID=A0A8J5CLK6_CHIOP|nr:hypothetical protein GWK47_012988 [Chionoecetes opilio]
MGSNTQTHTQTQLWEAAVTRVEPLRGRSDWGRAARHTLLHQTLYRHWLSRQVTYARDSNDAGQGTTHGKLYPSCLAAMVPMPRNYQPRNILTTDRPTWRRHLTTALRQAVASALRATFLE